MPQISVLILMGSDSDAPVMQAAVDVLRELEIPCEMTVASAHRSPERVMRLVREAPGRGVKLFIVGAGAAAHLAGVVAAHTTAPVIGVPIDSSALKGLGRAALDRADATRRAGGDRVDWQARWRRTPACSPHRCWRSAIAQIAARLTTVQRAAGGEGRAGGGALASQ